MKQQIDTLFTTFAPPKVGLPVILVVSFIPTALSPLGSKPTVFAYIKPNPEMFWPVIIIATPDNTLGDVVDWWIGYAAKLAPVRYHLGRRRRQHNVECAHHVLHPRRHREPPSDKKYFHWVRRIGSASLLVSWLSGTGDPLCTLVGWLRLKLWPSVMYIVIGKFLRYLTTTAALTTLPDDFRYGILGWIKSVMMRRLCGIRRTRSDLRFSQAIENTVVLPPISPAGMPLLRHINGARRSTIVL